MAKPQNKGKPFHKSNEEIRKEGITLIKNALKAHIMYEPLIETYFSEKADSSDVNWACYLMQQSVELSLKGLIKYYYEDFEQGHFVGVNAEILEELSENYKELREISDILIELQTGISVILNKWESVSRYKNIYVNKKSIEKVNDLLDTLMAFLHRHNYTTEGV